MREGRLVLGMSLLAGCGRIGFGELPRDAPAPSDVDAAPGTARAVAAGLAHSCALLDGQLSCWGDNTAGQLGLGNFVSSLVPARVEPTALWLTVTAGASHTCAVRDNGTLWCWGDNSMGQLGIGAVPASTAVATEVALPVSVRTVVSKFESTCAVLVDGTLWCWGVNSEGQLAQGTATGPVTIPVRVGSATWSSVAVGQGHMVAIAASSASGSGRNTESQLGLGAQAPAQIVMMTLIDNGPWGHLSAGQQSTIAIRGDGRLWGWGADNGVLGFATTMQRDRPELIDAGALWIDAKIDTFHGCGIAASGGMRCWGRNVEGQLGRGDNVDAPTSAPSGSFVDWTGLAIARFHSCAQRADGSVWCTGNNGAGELGVNDRARRNAWTQVMLP